MRKRHDTLRTEGLQKIYGKRLVVKGVDISVNRGEIVGLLGPNDMFVCGNLLEIDHNENG